MPPHQIPFLTAESENATIIPPDEPIQTPFHLIITINMSR